MNQIRNFALCCCHNEMWRYISAAYNRLVFFRSDNRRLQMTHQTAFGTKGHSFIASVSSSVQHIDPKKRTPWFQTGDGNFCSSSTQFTIEQRRRQSLTQCAVLILIFNKVYHLVFGTNSLFPAECRAPFHIKGHSLSHVIEQNNLDNVVGTECAHHIVSLVCREDLT